MKEQKQVNIISKSDQFKGASALFGAAFFYASFSILIREMAKMFGNNSQVVFRFGLAFLLLSLYGALSHKSNKLPKEARIKAALLGIAFAGVLLLFTISVNRTKIANSIFLLYGGSIISSFVIGTFVLKEKVTIVKVTAIVLSLCGLLMYSSSLLVLSVGVVSGLMAGLADGAANAIRKTLKGYNRNSVLRYQFAIGTLFSLMIVGLSGETVIKQLSLLPLIAGVLFACMQIGLGNLLLYGFQHFDVNVGTVILATELVLGALIGFVFYGEVLATREIYGGIIIFLASVISAVNLPQLLRRNQKQIPR